MGRNDPSKKSVKKVPPAKPAAGRRRESAVSAGKSASPTKTVVVKKTAAAIESQIRNVDKELVRLLGERLELAGQALNGDPTRKSIWGSVTADQELFQRVEALNSGRVPTSTVRVIYRELQSAARARVKHLRVAYLGPPFSFTHLAAIDRFGTSADLVSVNTIAAVFEEVNRGLVDYGVVPIENSTDGRIVDTLDMFTRLPLRICGEVQLAVHHNILARSPRSEITEIYSKPQALSQCRDWLSRNMPQARLIEVTSTSTAAQLARDKPGAAAVASRQAGVEYGLNVIAESIEDNAHNVTRFAVIGDEDAVRTGRDRTSILLQIPHTPGSLAEALNAFKNLKINLTWIESFPLRGSESGYMFFLDLEGHRSESNIEKALAGLAKRAVRMEILGSYPRCEAVE